MGLYTKHKNYTPKDIYILTPGTYDCYITWQKRITCVDRINDVNMAILR